MELATEHRDLFFPVWRLELTWQQPLSRHTHDVTTIHAVAMAHTQAVADVPIIASPATASTTTTTTTAQDGAKSPPPEKPADVRRRGAVILSFWLIVGLLGLPIWWYTTTIYRANLPLGEMMEWADGKACRPVFPLRIAVQAAALPEPEANHLLRLTQHALDDLNDFSGHHLRLEPFSEDTESALTIRLSPAEPTASLTAALDPLQPVLHVTYPPSAVPSLSSSTSTLATFVATQLRSTFAEEQAVISYLLSASSALPPALSTSTTGSPAEPRNIAPEIADALSKRTMRSLKYAPTYHLTFSLFTGGAAPSSWDIEAAVAQYMQPVLDVLAPIHNFTIDTQVQLYATPGVQSPVLTSKQDLSSFINAAEWPLSPSIGGAPTINFIVYAGNQTIQSQSQSQSQAEHEETSQSWLIPQWGSVYLLPADAAHVPTDSLREPLLTFTSHLLALLGTPTSGSLPLRLSTLSRIRSADLLLRASSTLGSLARLSLSLRNIAIPSSVAEGVASTMEHLRLACDALGGPDGLAHARIAEEEAERAFFEKSMVGQLYFPDEHKVAVYLPLLGPVGVPLVMGLLNELKAWLRRRKERAAAGSEKKQQ